MQNNREVCRARTGSGASSPGPSRFRGIVAWAEPVRHCVDAGVQYPRKGKRAFRSATNPPRVRSRGQTRRGQHGNGNRGRCIWPGEPAGFHVEHALQKCLQAPLERPSTGSVGHGSGGHLGTVSGRLGSVGQASLAAVVSMRYPARHVRRSCPGWTCRTAHVGRWRPRPGRRPLHRRPRTRTARWAARRRGRFPFTPLGITEGGCPSTLVCRRWTAKPSRAFTSERSSLWMPEGCT